MPPASWKKIIKELKAVRRLRRHDRHPDGSIATIKYDKQSLDDEVAVWYDVRTDPVGRVSACIMDIDARLRHEGQRGEVRWLSGLLREFTGLPSRRVAEMTRQSFCQEDDWIAWAGFDRLLKTLLARSRIWASRKLVEKKELPLKTPSPITQHRVLRPVNRTEYRLLQAVVAARTRKVATVLCKSAGLPYNSHLKSLFSRMVRDGILDSKVKGLERGYALVVDFDSIHTSS